MLLMKIVKNRFDLVYQPYIYVCEDQFKDTCYPGTPKKNFPKGVELIPSFFNQIQIDKLVKS